MKIKIGITLLALMFAFNLVSAADYSSCPMGGGTYGMMSGGYGSGFMLFGWVTYILIIVLIISPIYFLVKSANRKK